MEYTTFRRKTGSATGQMFFATFGTLWMTGWCLQSHGPDLPTLALIAFAGTTIFLWAWSELRRGNADLDKPVDPSLYKAQQRTFRLVNLTQWIVIVAAASTLNATGHARWIVPSTILIVGLHFMPLARLFRSPRHYVIGAGLTVVALAYPWMAGSGPDYPIGEFATGGILWVGALYGFMGSR